VQEQDSFLWPGELLGGPPADPDCQPEDSEELLVFIEAPNILAAPLRCPFESLTLLQSCRCSFPGAALGP
jgi:hypothetical protein